MISEPGPLRVAFDTTFPDRSRGGAAVYTRSLLAALLERDDVAPLRVSAPAGAGTAATLGWLVRGARRRVAALAPQVVHCPDFVCPWRLPVPYVVTIPDTLARRFPRDHPLEWRLYEGRLLPPLARRAAMVLTGSEHSRRELVRDYGLAEAGVAVTPFGVDARFFSPGCPEGPRAPREPRLLFPGAPLRRKNLPAVLRCLAGAPAGSALRRAELVITGGLPDRFPEPARLASRLGLEGRVRWLGQLPADELPCAFAEADVLVYPSLAEGFGFPPLEAMAAGTPVVCSDAGPLPEVTDGAALLVDPRNDRALASALEAALTRQELREKLRVAGRKVAARHTWARCAEATVEVYRQAVGRRRAWTA